MCIITANDMQIFGKNSQHWEHRLDTRCSDDNMFLAQFCFHLFIICFSLILFSFLVHIYFCCKFLLELAC
jgi:hypothetical protein